MIREHVHQKIDLLDDKKLTMVSMYLELLDQSPRIITIEDYASSVERVRNALSGLKGNLSDDIIAGREDRI